MKKENYRFKIKPYDHQYDSWLISREYKHWAYLMDMGIGKSKLLLDVAAYMYDQGWIDALMIFANKGSYTNWPDQHIPEHLPDHIIYELALWKPDLKIKEKNTIEKLFTSQKISLKIFVMNIEALPFKRSAEIAYRFVRAHNTLSVIDESTTIKNPKAKRTKAAWTIGKLSVARRILTGSFVDNKPLDAWAQFQFLGNGLIGHTSYYSFRAQYAELVDMTTRDRPRSFKVVVGYKNLDLLRKTIGKYATIIKSEDCLDLPPKIYEKFYVELTEEQKTHYQQLKKISITEIEESMTTVKIALTKMLRLHQLICGHLTDDNGNIHNIPHNRINALDSIIDETRGKVIIWANYIPDIRAISEHLAKEHGRGSVYTYYGDTSQEKRDKAKKAFKKGSKDKTRFLIGNPTVGGYGLNLTGANTVIYYSNSFDGEVRNQSEKRAHRIGQTKTVTYIDLVAKKTVDEKILKALLLKKSVANLITESNWKEFF